MSKYEKEVYVDGSFVVVAPKKPKNSAERNRYVNDRYDAYKRMISEDRKEKEFSR